MHLVLSFKPSLNCCTVLAGGPKQCTMTLLAAHSIMGWIKHSHFTWSIIVELSISLLKIYYMVISIRFTWAKSNTTGTWPSRGVSTLFTLVSQWNHDISHQKLQHYSTGTDIYVCCFGFQARTVWPERFHLWNLQKRVDRRDWPLNLVLCFRSSPSVKHSLCSWQLG